MKQTSSRALGAACIAGALATILAACGGGGSHLPATDQLVSGTDVPESATTSAAAAVAFVAATIAASSDSTEPLVVGSAELATSDSDEPVDL